MTLSSWSRISREREGNFDQKGLRVVGYEIGLEVVRNGREERKGKIKWSNGGKKSEKKKQWRMRVNYVTACVRVVEGGQL